MMSKFEFLAKCSPLKQFINGGSPASIRHIFWLLGILGAGVIAGTLLYAEVKATEKKTDENRVRVEAVEKSINKMTTQQQLLLQGASNEKELNKEFRKETSQALREILIRLPRQERPR